MQHRIHWIALGLGTAIALSCVPATATTGATLSPLKDKENSITARTTPGEEADSPETDVAQTPATDEGEASNDQPSEANADQVESGQTSPEVPVPTEDPTPVSPAESLEELRLLRELQERDTPPEYLEADPNPLLYPTQTEEVEIIGSQPITLEEALTLVRRNSRDLQVAQLELERSRAALREAQAANYPTVQAGAGLQADESGSQGGQSITLPDGSQLDAGGGGGDDINVTLSGTVELSYNLFTAGRRPALIRAAEEQVRLNELNVEQIEEQLRLNVATAYYDLQEADELVRINAASLEEALQSRRDAQIREQAGVGTRFDVLQAEVQVANAQQDLTQARSQQAIAQRQLSQILSIPPRITVTAVQAAAEEAWPLTLEESIIVALQNRSELEQQLVQREISEQQRRAALAALGPQVSLFANYNIRNLLTDENSGFRDSASVGARLNLSLYDGGAARAQARQQERNIEIAETQFADSLETVRFEVEQAFYNQAANRANIDTAQVAVDQAREALRLARLRFQAGVGTQLEVISAQSDLTRAEGNLIRAIIGYNRAIAALERAVSNIPESRLLPSLEIPSDSNLTNPLGLGDQNRRDR